MTDWVEGGSYPRGDQSWATASVELTDDMVLARERERRKEHMAQAVVQVPDALLGPVDDPWERAEALAAKLVDASADLPLQIDGIRVKLQTDNPATDMFPQGRIMAKARVADACTGSDVRPFISIARVTPVTLDLLEAMSLVDLQNVVRSQLMRLLEHELDEHLSKVWNRPDLNPHKETTP